MAVLRRQEPEPIPVEMAPNKPKTLCQNILDAQLPFLYIQATSKRFLPSFQTKVRSVKSYLKKGQGFLTKPRRI